MLRRRSIFLVILTTALPVMAAEPASRDLLFQPVFQFQKQGYIPGLSMSDREGTGEAGWQERAYSASRLNQYNATFSYPWYRDNYSVGVGVNIRFIEGVRGAMNESDRLHNGYTFNTTLPMFYASAIFNLPFQGLQASVAGSIEYEQLRSFDYRAKLSYTFDNGFGLQGGWQHQQLNLDGTDNRQQFENKGPFVDFYFRF